MSDYTTLGNGTLTLGDTPTDFSGEVLGASISHTYEDVGSSRRMLDGTNRAAGQARTDGLTASCENDLTAAGLYKFLLDNDGKEVAMSFTPSDQDGAEWTGTVLCRLPATIGADEYGAPLVSDLEVSGVGTFAFTPATGGA